MNLLCWELWGWSGGNFFVYLRGMKLKAFILSFKIKGRESLAIFVYFLLLEQQQKCYYRNINWDTRGWMHNMVSVSMATKCQLKLLKDHLSLPWDLSNLHYIRVWQILDQYLLKFCWSLGTKYFQTISLKQILILFNLSRSCYFSCLICRRINVNIVR